MNQINLHHVSAARATLAVLIGTLIVVFPQVALAQTDPWEGVLQRIVDILTGDAARLAAIIAVASVGITAWAGRMQWSWAGSIIGGIVLVFGAAQIVDIFAGVVGA
ncbi:MAG: TrbC/VirB2 family protein [Salinisphaera sp.]|nr:TrbC/VirB2 family protein [Salinisphaera sp.]